MSKILILISLLIVGVCDSKNEGSEDEYPLFGSIDLDTIILKQATFTSNLENKTGSCFTGDFEVDTLKVSDVVSMIKTLNKELRTSEFDELATVVGKDVKFRNYNRWARVMELHFEDEEKTEKLLGLLNKLESGLIRHTIYPAKCIFKRTGKFTIFFIQFIPVLSGKPEEIYALFDCI